MSLDTVTRPLNSTLSGRFFLVSYLPTVTAAVFVLLLLWAGRPRARLASATRGTRRPR
jgi:hypothetical protein